MPEAINVALDDVDIDPWQCVGSGARPMLSAPWLRRYGDKIAVEASDTYVAITSPINANARQLELLGDRDAACTDPACEPEASSPLPSIRGLVPTEQPVATVVVDAGHMRRSLLALGAGHHAVELQIMGGEQAVVIRPVNNDGHLGYQYAGTHLLALVMPLRDLPIREADDA